MTTFTINQSVSLKQTTFETVYDAIYQLTLIGLDPKSRTIYDKEHDPDWIMETSKNKRAYTQAKKNFVNNTIVDIADTEKKFNRLYGIKKH